MASDRFNWGGVTWIKHLTNHPSRPASPPLGSTVIRIMQDSHEDLNEWSTAYIEAMDSSENVHEHHPLFWAVDKFFDLEIERPDVCWEAILDILSKKPSDRVLGVLAAGPLEDLINNHGSVYIEKIETEARRNPAFRHLLGGVWESGTPDVWGRVEKIRGKPW